MRGRPSRALARLAAGVVALAAVALTASPAFASTGKIDGAATLPTGSLGVYFSAVGLQPGQSIDLDSVTATVGGTAVKAEAKLVSDTAAKLVRKTMLTIDISGSMTEPISSGSSTSRIEAARTAATTYLKNVPADVLVGLVTFEDTARVVVKPTTNHAEVTAAVAALQASNGNTALYEAVRGRQRVARCRRRREEPAQPADHLRRCQHRELGHRPDREREHREVALAGGRRIDRP